MTATARIDATAEIDPSYFPGGASVNLRLGPKRPANRSVHPVPQNSQSWLAAWRSG